MTSSPTILVVDDDTAHRTMLRALIGGWDYAIIEADDGAVAIEKVRERPFDLILMDIRMLKVSGLEAMDEIKKINPAIPIIIMTAYSSVETAVSALKTRFRHDLTTPLKHKNVGSAVQRELCWRAFPKCQFWVQYEIRSLSSKVVWHSQTIHPKFSKQ